MRRMVVLLIALFILSSQQTAESQPVIIGPSCFVIAEVAGVDESEMPSQGLVLQYYDLKVLEIDFGTLCDVQINGIYRLENPRKIPIKMGQKLKVGLEIITTTIGAREEIYIIWSNFQTTGGLDILHDDGSTLGMLKSTGQPIAP